jgi:hypothetical protein
MTLEQISYFPYLEAIWKDIGYHMLVVIKVLGMCQEVMLLEVIMTLYEEFMDTHRRLPHPILIPSC